MTVARCGRRLSTRRCPCRPRTESRRLFLPGFTKPGSATHFGGVWEDLAEAFDRLGEVDIDVIIDCGRLGPHGLPAALLERSAADRSWSLPRPSDRS